MGREREAREAFRRALDRNPADMDAVEAIVASGAEGAETTLDNAHVAARNDLGRLLDLGRICLRTARPEKAEEVLLEVLESAPTDAPALMLLAMSREMRGDFAGMVEPVQRFLGLQPDDAQARLYLGLVLNKIARHDEALPHLEHAQTLGLDTPHLFAAHAEALTGLGREDEARQLLREGLRRHPDEQALRAALEALG